ncbi:AraC family transcriptional regulator [Halovulum sp. GXIMD14794]
MASAAGLTIGEDGIVRSGEDIVYRLDQSDEGQVPASDLYDLIEWIRANHPDMVALVFAYADKIQVDHLGVLGLAIKTAPTLRGSLRRVERYFQLVTDTAEYRLEEDRESAYFVIEGRNGHHPALPVRNECALAGFARNMRRFVGEGLELSGVSFRHSCQADPDRYVAGFGCPVHFDADRDAICFAARTLDMPNLLGDPAVSNFLTRHLDAEMDKMEKQESVSAEPPIRAALLRHLTPGLSSGPPAASDAARSLGMSERTLFRRLSDEGLTYREVVQDAQIRLAQELLGNGSNSIAEVAFLTGFSEQSSFSRAFKRRVGNTPAQFRAQTARS